MTTANTKALLTLFLTVEGEAAHSGGKCVHSQFLQGSYVEEALEHDWPVRLLVAQQKMNYGNKRSTSLFKHLYAWKEITFFRLDKRKYFGPRMQILFWSSQNWYLVSPHLCSHLTTSLKSNRASPTEGDRVGSCRITISATASGRVDVLLKIF